MKALIWETLVKFKFSCNFNKFVSTILSLTHCFENSKSDRNFGKRFHDDVACFDPTMSNF